MKLVVVIILACVTAAFAKPLGVVGSEIGGAVGSSMGLGLGVMIETIPSVIGIGSRRSERPPKNPGPPPRNRGRKTPKEIEGGSNDDLDDPKDTQRNRQRGKGRGRLNS